MSTENLNDGAVADEVGAGGSALGEEGALNGSPEATPDFDALAAEAGVPVETYKDFYNNDESFAKLVKDVADDKGGEDDDTEGEQKPDEDSAADDKPEGEQKPDADDRDSGTGEDEAFEFADDVIKGIKGADMAKLPKEAQSALAEFYEGAKAQEEAAAGMKSRMEALLEDPVIAARAQMIEAGRPDDLAVRGMTAQEKAGVIKTIQDKLGLDDDDAATLLTEFGKGIEAIAKDMAQDLANRSIVVSDAQRKAAEVNKQGNEMMLSLSQFNKNLAVNEKDLSKFYKVVNGKHVLNESHPEAEKFKNGLGRIQRWASEQGIGYAQLVKMGDKAFYAAAAAALDMPVAFNTSDRDKKMVADATKKKLAPFLKANATGTLHTQGSVKSQDAGAVIKGGYNIIKLAEDLSYRSSELDKYWNNEAKMTQILKLSEEGQTIIDERKKNRR